MSYLGLDIGTTGCKAAIFDAEGRLLSSSYKDYPLYSPKPGWAELDSCEVISKCKDVIREAALKTPDDPVQAMCVSSQGEAFTPIDKSGEILRNAMVSSDSRAASLTESLISNFGSQKLYEITGHTAYSMFTLFKMLWLRENESGVWKNTNRFCCF